MSELLTGNGEDVAARSVHWTASRKASRRDAEVKRDGMPSGCMSHMIKARLILVLVIVGLLWAVAVGEGCRARRKESNASTCIDHRPSRSVPKTE